MTIYASRLPMAAVLACAVTAAGVCFDPNRVIGQECSGDYGTEVKFVDSAMEASKLAVKQEKLVFVLHVSGNFEESKYT